MAAQTEAAPQAGRKSFPLLAALFLFTIMLPISFKLGSLNLTPSRILLTATLPFLLIQCLIGAYGRVLAMDIFVILFMSWRTLATYVTSAPVAFEYSASNAAIFLGAYLVARASIRSLSDFWTVSRILSVFVIFSLPFALYEAKTSYMVIPRFLEHIPGIKTAADVNYRPRNGIHRVQFVFTHPIHYGLFCSTAFGLLWISMRSTMSAIRRKVGGGIVLLCCFLSVSSGPFLALLSQVMFLAYDWIFRSNPKRWKILFIVSGVLYVILEVLSNRPILYVLSSKLAFNSSTANVRMVLLDYGMQQIPRTPIFGVGFMTKWDLPVWMSGSLDNFWLAMPLTFGIPAGVFMLGAFLSGMIGVGRRPFREGSQLADARLGWELVMFSLMLTLATVYIWAEIASLVFFMLGCGGFMMTAVESGGPGATAPVPAADPRQGPRPSRFAPSHDRRRGGGGPVPVAADAITADGVAAEGVAASVGDAPPVPARGGGPVFARTQEAPPLRPQQEPALRLGPGLKFARESDV